MPSDIILRGEDALPDDLLALLRDPPPEGVWHVPSYPLPMDLGFTQRIARALRAVTGRPYEAPQPDEFGEIDGRLGLWLTEDHLLLADEDAPRAVRREDIVRVRTRRVRRFGRPTRDLLVFDLSQGRLYLPVDPLDDWAGRPEELRAEVERHLQMERAGTDALEEFAAKRQFDGFVGWLDTEVRRLQPDPDDRARLLELTTVALSSWPDESRRALPGMFLTRAPNGSAGQGFARDKASWLLPLSRTVTFDAASHFPDAVSVADCAATFRNVPLTGIELVGDLADGAFEAFMTWAATKPLKALAMTDGDEIRQARLADFKRERGLS